MKKIFLTSFLFCSLISWAQTDKGTYFIDLTAGVAFASGNFIKTDYADSTSGFAQSTGLAIQWKSGVFIRKNFSINMVIGSNQFGIAELQKMADGFLSDFNVDSTTVTVKGKYASANYLLGPSYSYPLGKLILDAHVLAGISTLQIPQMKVDLEDNTSATFYQKKSSGIGFGLQSGIGIKYFLGEHFALSFNGDYLLAKPKVSIENENRTNTAGRYLRTYQQSIGGISAKLGLTYVF